LLLYIAIACVLYASIVLYAFHQADTHQPPGLPLKWLGFAAMTALVFGDTIRTHRVSWGNRRFWLFLAAFFTAQCVLGIAVLAAVAAVSTMVWAVLIPLDYGVLSTYLAFFLGTPDKDESGE
jgi:hypothetical protein